MRYISTRGKVEPIAFQDAVLMGLADDGGLVIPEEIPDLSPRLGELEGLAYNDLAFEIIRLYASDLPAADLRSLVARSYGPAFQPAVAPVVAVGGLHVLELWHGPTMSFKDVALQFLGNLFEYVLAGRGGRLNILGATSGDTGSAAIRGVHGRKGIHIFVMHPRGRVSAIQERQMTTVLDANVHNIAVEGSFDDCQRIMKDLAGDLDFKRRYSIGAVNSVNWARVLAQMVYYFHAALAVRRQTGAEKVRFCVPTGNFGDILAGWYAMRMGAPISRLILATNENDILSRFFSTGVYSAGQVRQTLAPAMDIQVASNFERYLYYKVGRDPARLVGLMEQFASTRSLSIDSPPGLRRPASRMGMAQSSRGPAGVGTATGHAAVDDAFQAGAASTDQMLEAIRRTYRRDGYLIDPHTACGFAVAEPPAAGEQPLVCIATAHPAKFPEAIRQAIGEDLARHPKIDELMGLPTRCQVLPDDKEAVRRFIIETVEPAPSR